MMASDNILPWHRRHAIQIAAALPENREDALIVLGLARELVESFLFETAVRPEPTKVFTIIRDQT